MDYLLFPFLAVSAPAIAAPLGAFAEMRPQRRLSALIVLAAIVLLLPLLLQPESRFRRFLLACYGLTVALKMIDLHVASMRGVAPTWRRYLIFLVNPLALVERKIDEASRAPTAQNLLRLARGVLLAAVGLGILRATIIGGAEVPTFALEYVVKTAALFLLIHGAGDISVALWRFPGWRARVVTQNFFCARTPAEFWRLYNRLFGQWFQENVFKPLGGWRRPARVTLIVFAFSALMHEYVFAVTLGRLQLYQTSFFLLHGCAVAVTQRWRPRGAVAPLAVVATLIFNLASATLFFASWCQMLPWYSDAAPAFFAGESWSITP